MNNQDPIADMLTRIRNANRVGRRNVLIPKSKICTGIAQVLKDEGYIEEFDVVEDGTQGQIRVKLKYATDGSKVMGLDAAGDMVEVTLDGLRFSAGKATSELRLAGNISSTGTQQTLSPEPVFDAQGRQHDLSLKFTNTSAPAPGSWKVLALISPGSP